MKQVFLNIPSLKGHRQIYCRQLCDYFLERDFSVTVATDLSGLHQYAELEQLRNHPNVRFIRDGWSDETSSSLQLRRLVTAAAESSADVVFLAEADMAQGLLAAQIGRPRYRIPGRRVGLFIRSTNYIHDIKRPQTGRVGRVLERGVLAAYKYHPLSPYQPRLFHEVIARRWAVLDAALCLDEVFVAANADRYGWLPDIAVASSDRGESGAETIAWDRSVSEFLGAHEGRPVVVYVGMPQERRGYEELLRLASDVDGCFVHCGALHDPSGYPHEDLTARAALISRSAILESGCFYQSFETARVTLGAAKCVVLPYLGHDGSSGVMLQALMAGRPVLVPDRGLMAWRVRNFGLGLTFAPDDWQDMRHKFLLLSSTPSEFFAEAIDRFLSYFGGARLRSALDAALGLPGIAPPIPMAGDALPVQPGVARP